MVGLFSGNNAGEFDAVRQMKPWHFDFCHREEDLI
jgi:hypothetical protein